MKPPSADDETLLDPNAADRAQTSGHVLPDLPAETSRRVRIEEPLGEGGMGLVWLATQSSLGRKVAVKTVHPSSAGVGAADALVREAWVTGQLEHPNIVPIHDVLHETDAQPLIVMKRIEGLRWSDFVRNEATLRGQFGDTDPLEWHLGVLQQVCNALHFAHSRCILHRDLKPANVMIGRFGEVYVLDWGLAVSLRADDPTFPRAADLREVAGTPAYMAPEMFVADGRLLSERTDVYLLGAVLHEILTGRPPNQGATFAEMHASARRGPSYPGEAPAGLVAIASRALEPDPAQRFQSAHEFAEALRGFLRHRGSAQIAEAARREWVLLRGDLDAIPAEGAGPARRQELYRRFGEVRSGFQHALRSWPQNPDAQRGLEEAVRAIVDMELAHGTPAAAAALLAELASPPPDLVHRVDEARRREALDAERIAELRVFDREMDPTVGRGARVAGGTALAALWTVGPLVAERIEDWLTDGPSHEFAVAMVLVAVVLTGALLVVWRRTLLSTAVNRWAVYAVFVGWVSQLIVHCTAWLSEISPRHATLYDFIVWMTVMAMWGVVLERLFLACAVTYALAAMLAAAHPSHIYEIMSGANLVVTTCVAMAWRSHRKWTARRGG